MTTSYSTASGLSRRRLILLGAAGALAGLSSQRAGAVLKLDVTQGNIQPIPIAIPDFVTVATQDPGLGRGVGQIIAANLQRSGFFLPIDQAAYIQKGLSVDDVPRYPDWRQINAQALVTGRVTQADGRLRTAFRLWDVLAGQQLHAQEYTTSPDNWRRIAHHLGRHLRAAHRREGLFRQPRRVRGRVRRSSGGSSGSRSWTRTAPMCAISRAATTSCSRRALVLGRHHHLHVLRPGRSQGLSDEHRDRAARDRQQLPGMSFSPRFSPDSQRVIFSLQRGGNPTCS
jgi:TolB protein